MDLRLYARVLWRFRLVVGCGLALGALLALLSFVRVNPTGHPVVSYRHQEEWVSYETLFVTQKGFPWGSLTGYAGGSVPTADGSGLKPRPEGSPVPADPARFTSLAVLYSQLATSDPVLRRIAKNGRLDGTIQAAPQLTQDQEALPIVSIAAFASTPAKSKALAARSANALRGYIRDQQARNGIPLRERVVLTPLKLPENAKLFSPRRKTLPIVIFLAVALLTVGLAFVLENVRPRVRSVTSISSHSNAA